MGGEGGWALTLSTVLVELCLAEDRSCSRTEESSSLEMTWLLMTTYSEENSWNRWLAFTSAQQSVSPSHTVSSWPAFSAVSLILPTACSVSYTVYFLHKNDLNGDMTAIN